MLRVLIMIYILQNKKVKSYRILEKGEGYPIAEIRKSFIKKAAFQLGVKDEKNFTDKTQHEPSYRIRNAWSTREAVTLLIFWEYGNSKTQGCEGNLRPLKRALSEILKNCA